jgi:hypothetical protein
MQRRLLSLAALVAMLAIAAPAFAAPPPNDDPAGAIPLTVPYLPNPALTSLIPATGAFGLADATWNTAYPTLDPPPICLGTSGYRSMWYSVQVPQPAVLTVSLSALPANASVYQPVLSILDGTTGREIACGLGSSDSTTNASAVASTYVSGGPGKTYLVRIASATPAPRGTSASDLPTLSLGAQLTDVTPPTIKVGIPAKIIGPRKTWTFDASASSDLGSQIEWSTAVWTFFEGGVGSLPPASADPKIVKHVFRTTGLHRVQLSVQDYAGNASTYDFYVYVHSYLRPTAALTVYPPLPGARSVKVRIKHNMPVSVRLVIVQGRRVLRVIKARIVKGSHKTTTLHVALKRRVTAAGGNVAIGGAASSLGTFPNTVPLLVCSVNPVDGGGNCG